MFVVIPDVLTEAEVATLRTNAASEDFLDGRLTAAGRARNVKNNLQTDRRSERMSEAQELITAALNRNSTLQTVAAPRRILPPRRSEARRVGNEGVSTCRSRRAPAE